MESSTGTEKERKTCLVLVVILGVLLALICKMGTILYLPGNIVIIIKLMNMQEELGTVSGTLEVCILFCNWTDLFLLLFYQIAYFSFFSNSL